MPQSYSLKDIVEATGCALWFVERLVQEAPGLFWPDHQRLGRKRLFTLDDLERFKFACGLWQRGTKLGELPKLVKAHFQR